MLSLGDTRPSPSLPFLDAHLCFLPLGPQLLARLAAAAGAAVGGGSAPRAHPLHLCLESAQPRLGSLLLLRSRRFHPKPFLCFATCSSNTRAESPGPAARSLPAQSLDRAGADPGVRSLSGNSLTPPNALHASK